MAALALVMRPTVDGWAVYLTNGQEVARYRGLWSEQLALRYLRRYVRPTTPRHSDARGVVVSRIARYGRAAAAHMSALIGQQRDDGKRP